MSSLVVGWAVVCYVCSLVVGWAVVCYVNSLVLGWAVVCYVCSLAVGRAVVLTCLSYYAFMWGHNVTAQLTLITDLL